MSGMKAIPILRRRPGQAVSRLTARSGPELHAGEKTEPVPAVPATENGAEPAPEGQASIQLNDSKVTIWGNEVKKKQVTRSGKSGRIYLPVSWVGKTVIVVKVD